MSTDETQSELDDKLNEILQHAEQIIAETRAKLDELLADLRTAVEVFRQERASE